MKYLLSLFLAFAFSLQIFAQINPEVHHAKHFRKTIALRDMEVIPAGPKDRSWKDGIIRNEENIKANRERKENALPWGPDPVLQNKMGELRQISAPIMNFDGIDNVNGVYPPDTDGDVGPNHYFQMINLSFAIWDKTGNQLYGPVANSTLWNGFIGPWTGTNDGDPIVLYDEEADRWLASQFAINTSNGTYWELIAISETPDPLGSWYQYAFEYPDFNDYPKFGIWHDAYYASFNIFGSDYNRQAVSAFERDKMLVGDSTARMILFDLPQGSDPFSMLPADFDGSEPPADAPNYFIYFNDDAWGYPQDQLRLWEFNVDWTNPLSSTFTESSIMSTQPFDSELCQAPRGRCIIQPGTTTKLETLSDRMMYRLQYRDFGSYQVMVANHTVDIGDGQAGIRWYELRNDNNGSGWYIYQQGTYAPDEHNRWMGSIAMNANGEIALGYTVSSDSIHPSVRYTGRTPDAAPGEMNIAEVELMRGTSSQSVLSRWGDYAMMSVDPVDDTTFWFTQEYMGAGWKTRISSFNFDPVQAPTAFAGPDDSICENSIFTTAGEAGFYNTVLWTTSGDGIFGNDNALEAPYWRGPEDLENGEVMLHLEVFGYSPGVTANDSMQLRIFKLPEAFSGNDTTICSGDYLILEGLAENFSSVTWTTAGDGIFEDDSLLNTLYFPGDEDILNGEVLLSLTSFPVLPCDEAASDDLLLTIDECTFVEDEFMEEESLTIVPNPNDGSFNFKARIPAKAAYRIEVIDNNGMLIHYESGNGEISGDLHGNVSLEEYSAGIYHFRLITKNGSFSKRFVIR